jgi:hypothetical protein
MSGNLQDHFCGFMVNVRLYNPHPFVAADYYRVLDHVAGSGKSVLWYAMVVWSLIV